MNKVCKCNKCQKEEMVNVFKLERRGYGSIFDSLNFSIYLCDECVKELGVKTEWFDNNLNAVEDLFIFKYNNEDKIVDLISSLSLEVQESIFNVETIFNPFKMDKEDWIKMYPNGFFN